jgi:hypothetical protein
VSSPVILFVHLGPALPAWLGTTLQQARVFNSCDIVLVAEAQALARAHLPASLNISQVPLQELGLSDKHREFREISPLDRAFREGFWTFTSERFFVLETVMAKLAPAGLLHVENDVMLYCDCGSLAARLATLYPAVAATLDNDERCVPGLLYFPTLASAAAVSDFFLNVCRNIHRARVAVGINDMIVLGALRRHQPQSIDHLPIVPPDYPGQLCSPAGHRAADPSCYWRNFSALGGLVFDAAALGQYLGGVDPRNSQGPTCGFVNESCVFDPRLLTPGFVDDGDGRRVPVVRTASGLHRVANLHIHSKNPEPFRSLQAAPS